MSSLDLTNPTAYGLPALSDGLPLSTDSTPLETDIWQNCWTIIEKETHGLLDDGNFNSTPIPHDATRKGSLVKGWSTGGTASLDYLKYLYAHIDQTDTSTWDTGTPHDALDHENYIDSGAVNMDAIPGSAHSFILDRPSRVLLQWNVFWVSEIPGFEPRVHSHVALWLDGEPDGCFVRSVPQTCTAKVGDDWSERELHGFKANRYWHGHRWLELDAGEHHVSLRHICHDGIPGSRIWVRGMRARIYPQRLDF